MKARRDHSMLETQRHLDEPGNAGGPLGVTDVSLHRTDEARPRPRAPTPQHRTERGELDRIPRSGSRPVRLDVLHRGRRDPRPAVGGTQEIFLTRAARRAERASGVAVVVDRAAQDHRMDRIAVGPRLRERLEHHDADPFAPHVAVRARVAELAASIGGEHPGL
jgi:hypothetical protein